MDDQTLRLLAKIREAMRNRYTYQYGEPHPQPSTSISSPQSNTGSTSESEPADATPVQEDNVVYPTMDTVPEPTETTEVLSIQATSAKATEVIELESTQEAMLKQVTVVEPTDSSMETQTPSTSEETKTTGLEQMEDDTIGEVEPTSIEIQTHEAESKATESAELKPTEGAESKPAESAELKPTEGAESKPTESAELKPTEGAESKPTESAESNVIVEAIETVVEKLMKATQIESEEEVSLEPIKPIMVEPMQPLENQQDTGEPKQITVLEPNEETVDEPKQSSVVEPNDKTIEESKRDGGVENVVTSMAELLWSVAESSEETLVESKAKTVKQKRSTVTSTVVAQNAGLGIVQAAVVPASEQFPDPVKTGIRVAMIGQSAFAVDVMERLHSNGHTIVGVFTIMDVKNREDPLAQAAREYNIPVFKFKSWRIKGQTKPEVLEQYKSVDAELNVLAYCSQYIPMEAINYPSLKSICYHPSILPRHRGASAINWTLISGDAEAGFSIFWADEGLDTGPILLQEKIKVQPNDTVDTLYRKFLYPAGVTAMEIAVDMIAQGTAPAVVQNEALATYGPLLNKPELLTIDFKKKGKEIHNFIRGLDSVPGARCFIKTSTSTQFEETQVFGSTLWKTAIPSGTQVSIENGPNGILHEGGILLFGSDGVAVNVVKIKIGGRFKQASALEQSAKQQEVQFTDEEAAIVESIKKVWEAILKIEIEDHTDFFAAGAASMDVVRLIEEVKELMDMYLDNEEIFMSPVFDEFCKAVILKSRQTTTIDGMVHVEYNGIDLIANNRVIRVPTQMFIDGKFVDAENGKTTDVINPTDESVICKVPAATVNDVNKAVAAAKKAFEEGEWRKISARERGNILLKLSYFLEDSKEQLATLEAVDSGAVYTLALKTHVGMSIETWRYFGGWTDKIQGATIPISDARPNKNLSFTKKEPIGVCGLITPWNYPLMMLSWKMAACLAAGNTVVIKPAQVCPLTALKFAELAVRAGIPPGVINIVTGSGSVAGNAIAAHPDVRKVGFTGSTEIGKVIMQTCTENVKKVSLELGGRSPLVIFSDCDMDKAVKLGMQSVFFNKGENCIAAGRIFVEASIYTEFIHRVVKETKKIVIGDPLNRATAHGPQNHLAHLKKLEEFVQAGLNDGARLVYGGKRLIRPGYFFEPTILADVEDNMFIAREESFGPIMCISKFDDGDMDGVLKRANNTEYGLASGVFTQDISKALKFADKIESGTVFINTYNKTDVAAPFGGFKQSGFGKDLGQEALNEYLKTKTVTIEY